MITNRDQEILDKLSGVEKKTWHAMIDFGHFCNNILGYQDMLPEHYELCAFLEEETKEGKLILMPRYSFKSCIVTIGFSLWYLARNFNDRILIYSDSATKAQGFLQGIKNHILGEGGTSQFRKLFGPWETDPHKGKWNEAQIIIRNREEKSVEPSVDTGGIESSKVGMHFDMIIFDDIVSDLNTTTKAWMDKVYDCYKKSMSLLKPGGKVIVVGTRWNFGDAYGRMINDGNFKVFLKRATLEDGTYPFAPIGLDKEFLDEQRKRQGSYIYSCLYQNSPVDDSSAIFKHKDFKFYGDRVNTKNLFITCTCDPAGEGDDKTAITVCGTDNKKRTHLLDCVGKHLKPNQIIDEIIRLSYAWHFEKFGIETTFFRGMLENELQRATERERTNKNFTPFSTEIFKPSAKRGEGKHARILSLQPLHERGDLLFPASKVEDLTGAFYDLAMQMLQYTQSHRPIHDDLLDSLAYHVNLIRPGYGEAEPEPPEDSFRGILRYVYKEQIRENKRLPRKYRQHYEPLG